jgi:hypothetical protein
MILPPPEGFDPDSLHPNDEGFGEYASNLSRMNLIRNAGFELKPHAPYADCPQLPDEVPGPIPYLWSNFGLSEAFVSPTGRASRQALAISPGGAAYQDVFGLSAGDVFYLGGHGMMEEEVGSGTLVLEFLDALDRVIGSRSLSIHSMAPQWEHSSLEGMAPSGTVRGRMMIVNSGTGLVFVDDLELLLAHP